MRIPVTETPTILRWFIIGVMGSYPTTLRFFTDMVRVQNVLAIDQSTFIRGIFSWTIMTRQTLTFENPTSHRSWL